MGSISYVQAIRPDTAQIKKLIENSLLFDWIIRIEYTGNSTQATWEQWSNSLFSLHSADQAISLITSCYTNNPGCVIRINAEKLRPETRMIFTVYKPVKTTCNDHALDNMDTTSKHNNQGIKSTIHL